MKRGGVMKLLMLMAAVAIMVGGPNGVNGLTYGQRICYRTCLHKCENRGLALDKCMPVCKKHCNILVSDVVSGTSTDIDDVNPELEDTEVTRRKKPKQAPAPAPETPAFDISGVASPDTAKPASGGAEANRRRPPPSPHHPKAPAPAPETPAFDISGVASPDTAKPASGDAEANRRRPPPSPHHPKAPAPAPETPAFDISGVASPATAKPASGDAEANRRRPPHRPPHHPPHHPPPGEAPAPAPEEPMMDDEN